jgi:hypothetical protein
LISSVTDNDDFSWLFKLVFVFSSNQYASKCDLINACIAFKFLPFNDLSSLSLNHLVSSLLHHKRDLF